MNRRPTKSAPDFTQTCIVMFGFNITWIFLLVWAIWGLIAVAALGWAINRWVGWLEQRRGAE